MDSTENIKMRTIREKNEDHFHYYGDTVRRIFLVIAIVMLVMAPFVQESILKPSSLNVIAIIVLVLVSGFMNPKQVWVKYISFFVSLLGLFLFGVEAIQNYQKSSWVFELLTIAIAILFLFAFYFSSKTLRGVFVTKPSKDNIFPEGN